LNVSFRGKAEFKKSSFHEAVAEASKSPRLQAASRAVRGEQWFPSTRLDIEDHVVHVMNSHRAIYLAIREQDAVGAAAAMGAEKAGAGT